MAEEARVPSRAAVWGISAAQPPQIAVEALGADGSRPNWLVRWRIANEGSSPVRIVSALQPHSGFRAEEQRLAEDVAPGASAVITLPVTFDRAPSEFVENGFLILRVRADERDWRVLARVRVTAGAAGEPQPKGAVITSQPVGFSREP